MRHSVRAAVKLICVYYLGLSHTYTHSWLVLLKVVAPFPLKKTHASLPHYQKKEEKIVIMKLIALLIRILSK